MKTTLLALTLNEIDGVHAIMPQIDRSWVDQIIIVDGGSTDGTVEWALENGYEVYVQQKKGIRHAYLEVLPLVKGDVILSLSPDGNCPVAAIPEILDKMREGYDLVIGSRYLGDAKSEDDDFVTAFGNWLFTKTVNILHGGSYTDAMVIYRAFKTSLVHDLDLDREESYRLTPRSVCCRSYRTKALRYQFGRLGRSFDRLKPGCCPRPGIPEMRPGLYTKPA